MSPAATPPALAPVPSATTAGVLPGPAPVRDGRPPPGLVLSQDERIALADARRAAAMSYQQLTRTIRAAAAGLARRGVRPDDVVGLHVADAVSFSIGSLAVRAAGAVPFPVGPGAATGAAAQEVAGEPSAQLAAIDVRILVTSAALASEAADLAGRSRVRQVICFGGGADGAPPGTMPFAGLLEHGTMRPLPRGGSDPALLCYPRGPQGRRRPAWVSYRALAADVRRLAGEAPVNGWGVVIAAPPCGDGRRYTALLDLAFTREATVIASASADAGDLLAVAREHVAAAVIAPASAGLPDGGSPRVINVPS